MDQATPHALTEEEREDKEDRAFLWAVFLLLFGLIFIGFALLALIIIFDT